MRVSIVIPTLNAAKHLPALIDALAGQKPAPPDEIIVVDSRSTDGTREILASNAGIRMLTIEKFSHGRSRNMGAKAASGDIVAFLSQDALPRDAKWLAELLKPFEDPAIAAAYSRQVPYPDANPMETYFLAKHFPDKAEKRTREPGETLVLSRVFFSNVSSAVRRSLLLEYPFDETLIMSEDQKLSLELMNAGHSVVYAAGSVVLHSHNYTIGMAFKRYVDSIYSLTLIFPKHGLRTSTAMGSGYVLREMSWMARRHTLTLPYYFLYTATKIAGTLTGHVVGRLPRSWARRVSLHKYHWTE